MRAQLQKLLQRKFVRDTLILQIGKVGVTLFGLAAWIIVPARMGTVNYGVWVLAQSFLSTVFTLDLTGLESSINTLMGKAWGKQDSNELRDVMASFLKMATWRALIAFVGLAALGSVVLGWLYSGTQIDAGRINRLAFLLVLTDYLDAVFALGLISFSTRRVMGRVAILQNVNQVVLTVCSIAARLSTLDAGRHVPRPPELFNHHPHHGVVGVPARTGVADAALARIATGDSQCIVSPFLGLQLRQCAGQEAGRTVHANSDLDTRCFGWANGGQPLATGLARHGAGQRIGFGGVREFASGRAAGHRARRLRRAEATDAGTVGFGGG